MAGRPITRGRAMMAGAAWAPQPGSQVVFLTCPVFETLYEGTRGPGKTDALLMDFAQHVGHGFGQAWRGVLFRRTYPQLGDVIAKTRQWFPQIWPAAQYNISAHEWTWPTGERLLLRHFARPDDYWQYHGHEYSWIAWEELCTWPTDEGYRRMMSCCRSARRGVPRKIRATANPYGAGHNWVKDRFRLPAWRGRVIDDAIDDDGNREPARVAIHGRLDENRILLDADPHYIDRLRAAARNPAELAAWIEGSWDIVAGGMFDDLWSPRHHVVPAFDPPSSWYLDRSFDWGSSKPFSVGWWAESDGTDLILRDGTRRPTVRGDLFRFAEWYGWTGRPNEGMRALAADIARGIFEREDPTGLRLRIRPGPADSSIFSVENAMSVAVDMSAEGCHWIPADRSSGSRRLGWELMRRMLRDAVPGDTPREKPGLFVTENCDQFRRTIPVLPRSARDMDDVDTDAEDHIADEARYRVLATRPQMRPSRNGHAPEGVGAGIPSEEW